MAWAFKKFRSLWNDGRSALLIAATVAIFLLVLLSFSDDCLAAPKKFSLSKIKWLQPYISDTKWLEPYIGRLDGLGPYISRENFLGASAFAVACALFVGIVQGTKAVARKLANICARTYRGFTNAVLRAYFGRAISINVNLFALLVGLSIVFSIYYDDDSIFVLVGYLGLLLLFVFLISQFAVRAGRFFDDQDNVLDLIRYVRSRYRVRDVGGSDHHFRQMLIEIRASEAEESRSD
jgi:hypothetical protein